jgi:hypothetical protein
MLQEAEDWQGEEDLYIAHRSPLHIQPNKSLCMMRSLKHLGMEKLTITMGNDRKNSRRFITAFQF